MNMGTVEWVLIRATGLSAVVVLTASMVLGLMMSLKKRSRRWPAVVTNDLHQFVSSLALALVGVHLGLLLVDSQAGIDLVDVVVPFLADSQVVAMGVGTLAVLALAAVWLSSVFRGRIGHARWRMIHGAAFGAYVMSVGHGVFSGTDTAEPWAWPMYVASVALVGWLAMLRIARSRGVRGPKMVPNVVARSGGATSRPASQSALPPLSPSASSERRSSSDRREPVRL